MHQVVEEQVSTGSLVQGTEHFGALPLCFCASGTLVYKI